MRYYQGGKGAGMITRRGARSIGLIPGLLLTALLSWGQGGLGAGEQEVSRFGNPVLQVSIGGATVLAEAVRTPAKLYLGLSHRSHLEEDRGMLFFMPETAVQRFCMREMRFPLDFIWIVQGRVAGITRKVPPEFAGDLISPEPVNLVLEVPAGFAHRHSLKKGDRVRWE